MREQLLDLPVYFDTAFSEDYLEGVEGMLTPEAFVDLVRAMGTHRVFFGTDSPWSGQKEGVEWIQKTSLAPQEKEQIFHENFERVIGI